MKIRNYILAIAIVAVAGINVYNAETTNAQISDLSLNGIEQLAEGEPHYSHNGDGRAECRFLPQHGRCVWTSGHYSVCYIWDC